MGLENEKSVKSQGNLIWISSGNPAKTRIFYQNGPMQMNINERFEMREKFQKNKGGVPTKLLILWHQINDKS